MPLVPPGVVKQDQIIAAIAEVEHLLAPDVARILYTISSDWKEDWAVYFRVVLSDEASAKRLMHVADRVKEELAKRLDFNALGLYAYHNFRNESEQIALRERAWA